MNSLRVAGVPEAYNDPFSMTAFTSANAHVTFVPYPGGSGSMLKALIAEEVDAAFALTDCIVAAIENGLPVRLAGPLIHTPLTWAVVVAPGGAASLEELSSATWGVSRLGSGSHVMVQTLATERRWSPPNFEVCGNFEGLRKAVNEGTVNAFLWEHYTTKPFADSGEVQIIGGVPTPWGCFSVVVRSDCQNVDEVRRMTDAFLHVGKQFLADTNSIGAVARKYGMTSADAESWIRGVRYAEAGERKVSSEVLELARRTLRNAGVIKEYTCKDGVDGYHV